MNILIIDDEPKSARHLESLIREKHPSCELRVATSPGAGRKEITSSSPDILFLDVEMPGETGFDLLETLPGVPPRTVFVTAHDKYALRAFRFAAVDYLLKPVDPDELEESIARISNREQSQFEQQMKNLIKTFQSSQFRKIALPTVKSLLFVEVKDILYIEAAGSYTGVHMKNGDEHMVSKNLKHFESTLTDRGFLRIHHSYIINLNEVVRYDRGEGGTVSLNGSISLPVSKSRKNQLLHSLM